MKVYAVTKGEYSDYHICCVVDNKELAEELAKRYSDKWNTAEVEEYDTENYCKEALKYKNAYCIKINSDSSVSEIYKQPLDSFDDEIYECTNGIIVIYTYADDEVGAIKSAMDKRAKYLADGIIRSRL